MGDKLFAVPWNALKLDTVNKRFVLNVDKARFESAPGFDSNTHKLAKAQAQDFFVTAIRISQAQEAKSPELRATMSLARLWQSQGKKIQAQSTGVAAGHIVYFAHPRLGGEDLEVAG